MSANIPPKHELPEAVRERIEQDAEAYSDKRFSDAESFSVMKNVCNDDIYADSYQAGAEAEAMRAMKLVEAIQNWKLQVETHGGDYLPGNYKQLTTALSDYLNQRKETE